MQPLPKVKLRVATLEDAPFLWMLRNDGAVRKSLEKQAEVGYDDYVTSLTAVLKESGTTEILVAIDPDEQPIGFVQLKYWNTDGSETNDAQHSFAATIFIGISRNYRGRGYGTATIVAASGRAVRIGVKSIIARVKIDNYKALWSFDKANYRDSGEEKINGIEYARMVYP